MTKVRLLILFAVGILFLAISCTKPVSKSSAATEKSSTTGTLTETEEEKYLARGKEIAQGSFQALSSALQGAMSSGGVEKAMNYCNVSAMPLTDSLSNVYNAQVKRTALKYRNPQNKPTEAEETMLNAYMAQAAENQEMSPEVKLLDENHIAFYAPIKTMGLCLTCHGTVGESLTEENYKTIKALYPEDQAVGFDMGDLRGMWSITFERNPDTPRQTGTISLDTRAFIAEMKKYDNPILIDVRTPEEFVNVHIDGSINMNVRAKDFKDQIAPLDKDVVYFINCQSGIRSTLACNIMEESGFRYLRNLERGILAWQKEGHPVVKEINNTTKQQPNKVQVTKSILVDYK